MGKMNDASMMIGRFGSPGYVVDFVECDTCRALPGTPPLCSGCLHNRNAINTLHAALKLQALSEIKGEPMDAQATLDLFASNELTGGQDFR